MTAKTRYRLLVAFSFLLGGAIVLPVACTSFVSFLEVLRAPIFLLSMFASVGLELATVLSLGSAHRKYKDEKRLEQSKKQELPPPPVDFDDPDVVAAVEELNEFLPGSDLDIQEWRKEYEPPKPEVKSTTWNDLAAKGRTWEEVGCGGAGGDASIVFGTYVAPSYNVQYKGLSITRPSAPRLASRDELDGLRSYLAERQFSLNSWEIDRKEYNSDIVSYKFCLVDEVSHKRYVLPVRLSSSAGIGVSQTFSSLIVDELRKTVDHLAAKRLSQQLMVPAGLIEMSYKEDGSVTAYVDVKALQKAEKRRRNMTESRGPG